MANAEDSEPLLGHNGSSIWTVSPRSKVWLRRCVCMPASVQAANHL